MTRLLWGLRTAVVTSGGPRIWLLRVVVGFDHFVACVNRVVVGI